MCASFRGKLKRLGVIYSMWGGMTETPNLCIQNTHGRCGDILTPVKRGGWEHKMYAKICFVHLSTSWRSIVLISEIFKS